MKLVSEDDFFVCFTIVVGVLVDKKFVIGLGFAGFPVWIGGHGSDPEAVFIVEGDLDRVGQVGEFFFGGKEVNLISGSSGEGGEGVVAVEVFGGAVFVAGPVVGFNFWEVDGFGIGGSEIEGFTLGGGPDGLVAIGGHLLELFKLGWIVFWAERIVASAVDVDPVWDFVVFFPVPVFFADGVIDAWVGCIGKATRSAKKVVVYLSGDFCIG